MSSHIINHSLILQLTRDYLVFSALKILNGSIFIIVIVKQHFNVQCKQFSTITRATEYRKITNYNTSGRYLDFLTFSLEFIL